MVSQGDLPVQQACQAIGLGRASTCRPLIDSARAGCAGNCRAHDARRSLF